MTDQTRCLCGATRATFDPSQVLWTTLCHCESCRRATSAPVVGWFGVANGAWAWAGAPPGEYESSPNTFRNFCTTCGSPMAFRSDRWPGETHFPAVTLENSETYVPQSHCFNDERVPWLTTKDDLPKYAQSAPSFVE